ncbi:retrovirus-related pol polyprotein from transposon TNT 1-94 [Tanacetum coccineum]
MAAEVPQNLEYRGGLINAAPLLEVENFTNWKKSPDDKEDTRSSHEYLNDIEEEYQVRALLAKFKRVFKKELRPNKDFEAKYNKVKAKLALSSSSASAPKSSMVKNQVKVLMALADDNVVVSKEGARNEQNGVAERKNRTLIEAARTMLSGSVFSKQYWTEVIATACYTQNRYSLVSKAFRVFNTKRQQTEETYHITFDESPDAIKFTNPSIDNINIAESERYPPDEYLHPFEPSHRY